MMAISHSFHLILIRLNICVYIYSTHDVDIFCKQFSIFALYCWATCHFIFATFAKFFRREIFSSFYFFSACFHVCALLFISISSLSSANDINTNITFLKLKRCERKIEAKRWTLWRLNDLTFFFFLLQLTSKMGFMMKGWEGGCGWEPIWKS